MKICFSKYTRKIAFTLCCLFLSSNIIAQQNGSNNSTPSHFTNVNESSIIASNANRYIIPSTYRTFILNTSSLKASLNSVQQKNAVTVKPAVISLPNPDGTYSEYKVYKNTTMHSDLEANYPNIRTYDGVGIDNPGDIVKFDITPNGFHAMILTTDKKTIFIDPYAKGDIDNYQVYYKNDYANTSLNRLSCELDEVSSIIDKPDFGGTMNKFGTCELRTYRLALACTGEYAAAVGGGTVSGAMAAQVTTMNRVNGIFERDVAVTMTIIANNNLIIYTNAGTDPYTDNNAFALIGEVQTDIDTKIGSGNYDIGHVFSTGGGGLAGLGVVCINGQKGRGVTGSANPQGDAYDIDYVAHEMGHQFSGNHTFNNSCVGNRNGGTAMEPGSGSSIMAYAGICAPNVQSNSDALFHGVSLGEIGAFITGTGDGCPVKTALANTAPSITGSTGNITIPQGTPFALTLVATDPDANTLSYTWEQMDNQVSTQSPVGTSTDGPNFRSILPSSDPTRYFPNLTDLVAGGPFTWEVLPTVSRSMTFRGVVRDNSAGGGCTDNVDITITVDASGPFVVTVPSNTGIVWAGTTTETVTWNEAGTSGAPVSCANVDILLSTDGGLTYPTVLATNVPNNGTTNVTVPNTATSTARIMVICSNGTFFDISNNNFTISASTFNYTIAANPRTINVCPPADGTTTINIGSIGGFNDDVTLSVTGIPAGATSSFATNPVTPVGTSILTISNTGAATPGTYPIVVQAVSSSGIKTVDITLIIANPTSTIATLITPINASTGVTIPTAFNWSNSGTGTLYDIDISTDPGFSTIIDNSVALSNNSYNSAILLPSTTYYWRVRAYTLCSSAAFSSTFSFTTTTNTCITTMSGNIPVLISATSASTITSIITIPTNGTITDINVVSLTGQHSWINDLTVTLTSPQGTVVSLWSQICNNENNFNLNFDDAAAPGALPCPPIGGGTYQTAGSLASFNGEISAGVWTLTIKDVVNIDGGSLDTWGLEICATPCTTIPTFTQLGPYCIGDAPGTLPTTSTNSFTGTWDAAISTASAGSTTYNFTPAAGQCAVSSTMDVVVSAFTTPTFTQLGPYCVGDTPATLPTTSDNSITGTWDATISTTSAGTISYNFTPTTGCTNTATMDVVVNAFTTPTFTQVGPYCVGDTPATLPTTSDNGISGTWDATISTSTAGTVTYNFTPTTGCNTTATMDILVNANITPTFMQLGPYCVGDTPATLPTTSDNGVIGTWDAIISTAAAGSITYNFTPANGCGSIATMDVIVNANVTPTFTQVGPYCVGDTPATLPTTSDNGITGTWDAIISTATAGTVTYNFTPTTGCNTTTTMDVLVNANVTPTFTQLGPYCVGDTPATLPTTSDNGITGTWDAVISTTTAGTVTYNFTPTTGCNTNATMDILVNANITPTFTQLGPYCVGDTPATLPTTSDNGVIGTWDATISTAAAGSITYNFTPANGCGSIATMDVLVNANVTPTFTQLGPYCVGDTPATLPTTSDNGITGTWDAAISTTTAGTVTYNFTPTTGCNTNATMDVAVSAFTTPTFTQVGPYCVGDTPATLPTTSDNGITGTWDALISTATAGTVTYNFTPTSGCNTNTTMDVLVSAFTTPIFTQVGPYCIGDTPATLPTTSDNGIAGNWDAVISTATAGTVTYNFTPTTGCNTNATMDVAVSAFTTPTFAQLGPYCVGDTPATLPTTSDNGIAGTWDAIISTATAGTVTYNFTPTGGCNTNATMDILVNANITPTFSQLGPYCVGDTPATLPTTSDNGVIGTWGAAISTTTAGTVTYNFTPTTGCNTNTTMDIVVIAYTTPTFTQVGPYCVGDTPATLPTTSDNGIVGTWDAAISTSTAGTVTYNFTPTTGCNTNATMDIVVIAYTTPTFIQAGPYCIGDTPATLPTTSDNGIAGTWDAAISTANADTITYNFTPTTGCNTNATMNVAVRAYTTPTFIQVGPYCVGDTPPNLPTTSDNGIAGTWDATISTVAAGTITYNFTSDQGQCAFDTTTIITTNDLPIITTSNDTSICINQIANLFATGAVTYLWNNSIGNDQLQTVSPNETTTYLVIGTDINSCSSTNTILVTIDNSICFNIPNVFSPNGDGKNDTWVLRGMEDYSDATIAIFNRWGSEIFNTSNTQNFWDGTYNGTNSPAATYYYFIDLGDGSDPINGTVNIIR